MTTNPKKLVVNLATGKEEYIELTPDEINERLLAAEGAAARRAQEEAAAAALEASKQAVREKLVLGQKLTAEEAALVVL